ncbi:carboxypeptidase-like regulatory domain-containing protein [Rarobacter faecitabidus]|uniref:carboxypeptidase-like regulatory domain-containing protein n=1 Tax=Rarobacter faecitabidus TaxID=13243 RepID=UPI001476A916|nr:carboxypeptidase-like regulatory domain-containing protein [Rarobacter faecitabidus]
MTIKIATKNGVGAPGLYVALGDTIKKTKADGTVRFKRVKSGKQRIVVSVTKGLVTTGWQYSEKIKVPAKKKATVTVRTSSLTVVKGKVTRKKKAVKKKVVSVFLPQAIYQAKTDKNGKYAIAVPKPLRSSYQYPAKIAVDLGNGRLVYAKNNLRVSTAKKYRLSWNAANTVNIKVTSDPVKGAIAGTIRDASGARAAGVKVHVETVNPSGVVVRTALTGAKGRFSIGGLPKATYRVYAVDPDQYSDVVTKSAVATVKVGAKKISVGTLSLPKVGDITAPITAPASRSNGVRIVLQDEAGSEVASNFTYVSDPPAATNAKFQNVPVGRYRVVLAGMNTASAYFDVAAGGVVTAPALLIPTTVKANGKVTLPDNSGISASVQALDSNGTWGEWGYSSTDGAFTISDLGPGAHKIYAFRNGTVTSGANKVKLAQVAPVQINVTAGVPLTGVNVSLNLGGTATGKVIDAKTKKTIERVQVVATRVVATGHDELDVVRAATTAKGTFRLQGLAPGVDYRVAFVDGDGVYRTSWYSNANTASKAKLLKVSAAKSVTLTTAKLKR